MHRSQQCQKDTISRPEFLSTFPRNTSVVENFLLKDLIKFDRKKNPEETANNHVDVDQVEFQMVNGLSEKHIHLNNERVRCKKIEKLSVR